MTRLQPRTRLAGTSPATALAAGAGLTFATTGSSSPDADAKTAKTAARLDRLATTAKTAPASRALNELGLNLNDCMMCVPIRSK